MASAQKILTHQQFSKIDVEINGKKETFSPNKNLFHKETKIDISRYIEDGSNTIIFEPSTNPLKVYIEIIEPYEKKQCFENEIEELEEEPNNDND